MNDSSGVDEPFRLEEDSPACASCGGSAHSHAAYPPYGGVGESSCDGYRWPTDNDSEPTTSADIRSDDGAAPPCQFAVPEEYLPSTGKMARAFSP